MKIPKVYTQSDHKTNKHIKDLLIALTDAKLHEDLKIVTQHNQFSVANEDHLILSLFMITQ